MTREEYDRLAAVNWSTLRELAKSPAHYLHALTAPRRPTAVMQLGTAIHAFALEPDAANAEFVCWRGSKRTKGYTAFAEEHAHCTILTGTDYDAARRAADAVRAHPEAAALLTEGQAESTLTWEDDATGRACKARLDWHGELGLVELKSTKDPSPGAFQAHAYRLLYHGQLAHYLDGLAAHGHWTPAAYMIAVESDAPYDVCVYRVGEDVLSAGAQLRARLMARLVDCEARESWPGVEPAIREMRLPAWAGEPEGEGAPF